MSFYFTKNYVEKMRELSFDDIMNGVNPYKFLTPQKDTRNTITLKYEVIPEQWRTKTSFGDMRMALRDFNQKYKHLEEIEDKSVLYSSFKIPKRSGHGLRPIDKPNDELMEALLDLKKVLETWCFASYHSSAYAYVKGRCTRDAVAKHQANESKWFLKLDLHGFFPSTTFEFCKKMIYKTFPYCLFEEMGVDEEFSKALSLCFLRGGLPQGTPVSPMLTNMMMIPIDFELSKMCREHKPYLIYTRYADDMDISSRCSFMWTEVQSMVESVFNKFGAPFCLNKEKTHYGSNAGRNWMLGLMLNKDNQITVGHENKKVFKAMVFEFIKSYDEGNRWSLSDLQHLQGLMSYYMMIEPVSIKEILSKYEVKFNSSNIVNRISQAIKEA